MQKLGLTSFRSSVMTMFADQNTFSNIKTSCSVSRLCYVFSLQDYHLSIFCYLIFSNSRIHQYRPVCFPLKIHINQEN